MRRGGASLSFPTRPADSVPRAGRATDACRSDKTLGVQQTRSCRTARAAVAETILNDTLAARHLALVEPLSVGFHAAARGHVAAGDRVAVLGAA